MELGVAGIDAGDEPCGCRSTGVVETVAREHGEGHAMALRVPGVAVKLMATVVWPLDGRSLVLLSKILKLNKPKDRRRSQDLPR